MGVLRNLNSRQLMWAAFFVACLLHLILLLAEISTPHLKFNNTTLLNVRLIDTYVRPLATQESRDTAQANEVENEPTEEPPLVPNQPLLESGKPEQKAIDSKESKEAPEPDIKPVSDRKNQQAEPHPLTTIVPSIHSKEFKRFLESETEAALLSKPSALSEFADTFVAPAKPVIEDVEPQIRPLAGGTYRVVRNGVECTAIASTPQSFDELTGAVPVLSGSGRCKDLKKAFDLLDKDGKIKNSDRYD